MITDQQFKAAHDILCSSTPSNFGERTTVALEAYERAAWQPIETAPRDGSWVLVWSPAHAPIEAYWFKGENPIETGWYDHDDGIRPPILPTMWRPRVEPPVPDIPLPEPPR